MPQMKINGIMLWPACCTKYWVKGATTLLYIAEIVMSAILTQLAGTLLVP
jgi:hypothetical protein